VNTDPDRINHQATTRAARCHHQGDPVIQQLLRLASKKSSTPPQAGDRLPRRAPDESALQTTHARVAPALAEHPSTVARRAAATLDAALDGPPVSRRLAPTACR
jgi:hypothetical protein